jgi:hypothetical protein
MRARALTRGCCPAGAMRAAPNKHRTWPALGAARRRFSEAGCLLHASAAGRSERVVREGTRQTCTQALALPPLPALALPAARAFGAAVHLQVRAGTATRPSKKRLFYSARDGTLTAIPTHSLPDSLTAAGRAAARGTSQGAAQHRVARARGGLAGACSAEQLALAAAVCYVFPPNFASLRQLHRDSAPRPPWPRYRRYCEVARCVAHTLRVYRGCARSGRFSARQAREGPGAAVARAHALSHARRRLCPRTRGARRAATASRHIPGRRPGDAPPPSEPRLQVRM